MSHSYMTVDQCAAAMADALTFSDLADLGAFWFGTGAGIWVGWLIGDLLRRVLRWYGERRV